MIRWASDQHTMSLGIQLPRAEDISGFFLRRLTVKKGHIDWGATYGATIPACALPASIPDVVCESYKFDSDGHKE